MKIQASFVQTKMVVAWTDDVPGALTQGLHWKRRENLIDACTDAPAIDLSKLPKNKIVINNSSVVNDASSSVI